MILAISLLLFLGCSGLNTYQTKGTLPLAGVTKQLTVVRDEKGMAYIFADSWRDAIKAYVFVTAQDRLFQMTLTRLFAQGRIAELAGQKAIALDTRMRTLGFHRMAKQHASILDQETRMFFQDYLDGVNAYIDSRQDTFPLEFKLAGIQPQPWSIEDSLSILYYMSWDTSANLKTEIIAQMLVEKLGPEKAMEIFPLNINPDDEENPDQARHFADPIEISRIKGFSTDKNLSALLLRGAKEMGSNNWIAGPGMTRSGKPIACYDPHLEANMLPGPWYPVGIIAPGERIVGVHIPGLPAMPFFRNQHIAIGTTNAYGDCQDLYVETLDPENQDRYLEGSRSIPLKTITEKLKIKDKKAKDGFRHETIKIQSTKRGPVVSGVLNNLKTKKVISLRWTPAETMASSMGLVKLIKARNVFDAKAALSKINVIALNFVFADTQGNIGWHATGRLPKRKKGNGTVPFVVVDDSDNWNGWIPFDEMPHLYNPEKGWVGTCNHHTVKRDYPYYYSSHQSPSYRYRRVKQLMANPDIAEVSDHWSYQRDTLNLMAEKLSPVIADILMSNEDTKDLARILSQWDLRDDPEKNGPTVFHTVYERFAWYTFKDELGDELAKTMLANWYFWQERFQEMVLSKRSPWFDDVSTPNTIETLEDTLIRAALDSKKRLSDSLGKNPEKWAWGRVHRHTFVSPIRRQGFGKTLVGGGSHPAPGSIEVLYRGYYKYNEPYDVTVSAALRMVADLSDEDKVLAVLPGGVAGRIFHPHAKDQIKSFMNGEKRYWWFSDDAIENHTKSVLWLTP